MAVHDAALATDKPA